MKTRALRILTWIAVAAAWFASADWLWHNYASLGLTDLPTIDTRADAYIEGKLNGYAPPVLALVLLMCLPVLLAIILLRGSRIKLFDDVPSIEARLYPYLRLIWLVILAAAIGGALAPERLLALGDGGLAGSAPRAIVAVFLYSLALSVSTFEIIILLVLISTVDPDEGALEVSMGWKIAWSILGGATVAPVAFCAMCILSWMHVMLVTFFLAGTSTAAQTRHLLITVHSAMLTVLLPAWLSFRRGREMALGFLAWNLPFLAIPGSRGFEPGGGTSGGGGAADSFEL